MAMTNQTDEDFFEQMWAEAETNAVYGTVE